VLEGTQVERAQPFGSLNGAAKLVCAKHACKITQRSGDGRNRDVLDQRPILVVKLPSAMHDYSWSSAPPRGRHFEPSSRVGQHGQHGCGTSVAQHGSWSAGQYGCHPSPMARQPRMADRIDTAMNAMQTPGANSVVDGVLAEADCEELAMRHNAMLLSSNLRHLPVGRGCFIAHVTIKVHRGPAWQPKARGGPAACVVTAPGV
jgi:hypothetical protein